MRILFSLICFSFLPNQCFLRTISLPSLLLLLLLLMLFLCLNFTQSFLLKHSLSPHSSTRSETAWTSRKLTGTLPFVFSVYGKIWLVRVFVVDTKVFIFYANAGFWSHSSSRFKCSVKKQHLWQCLYRGAVQSLWILWREGEGEREEKAKKKGEGSEWNKKLGLEENPW